MRDDVVPMVGRTPPPRAAKLHTRRRIPQLWTALLAGTAGLVLFAVPAQAQVDLTGASGTEPVEDTGTTVTTLVQTLEETAEDVGETVEEVTGDDGVAVDLPGTSVEVDAPDLLTDPLGSLDGLVTDDAVPEPSTLPGSETVAGTAAESARTYGGGTDGSPAGFDRGTGERPLPGHSGAVPGMVAGRTRPFVLTARDVGTFGLPLMVAGLLCAYLGMDSWMRRREPVAVPVIEDRDELLRFE